jgi:hypothetical protein
MKILNILELANMTAAFTEIRILKNLNTEFIIKYHDHFRFERTNLCIITEFCEVKNGEFI